MVRYYGLYTNVHRGKVRKANRIPVAPGLIEKELPRVPSKGLAEMIRKVHEVGPLICPRCGGTMKVVAFLTEHGVVDRIIRHLELAFVAEKPPPAYAIERVARRLPPVGTWVIDTYQRPIYPYFVMGRADSEPEAVGSTPRQQRKFL